MIDFEQSERIVTRPGGEIQRISSEASDLSVVNGARASFRKFKTTLDDKDHALIRRLLSNGHESPCEQHGLMIRVTDAPVHITNLIPDEIDVRFDGNGLTFPWTLNFRHAMRFYLRTRGYDRATRGFGAAVLSQFGEYMPTSLDSFLERAGVTPAQLHEEAGYGWDRVETLANAPTESQVIAAMKDHLMFHGQPRDAVLNYAWAMHPNLLNLYVFSWQLRGPVHVFWDLVRHRKSSPNGESGRYVKLQHDWIMLDPEDVRTQQGNPMSYERGTAEREDAISFIEDLEGFNELGARLYEKHMARGVAREQCSWFQTLAGFRTFVWTFRGLGLANMLALRNAPPALKELRDYAAEMEKDVAEEAPHFRKSLNQSGRVAP